MGSCHVAVSFLLKSAKKEKIEKSAEKEKTDYSSAFGCKRAKKQRGTA
jgi:hypothetical protein